MNRFLSLHKASLLALALGAGLVVGAPEAKAQLPVGVVACMVAPGIPCATTLDVNATTAAVTSGSTAITTQLGYTHTYLTTGASGGPGGVTALLGGINDRLGRMTNFNDETVENDDMAARQRMYDQKMMDVRGANIPKPSNVRRACVQATAASGRAGAARGSGGAARAAGAALSKRYDDNRNEADGFADAGLNRDRLGVCSQFDVDNLRPGCANRGVGERPNADARLVSLFDGGMSTAASGPVHLSIDQKGFEIGQQVISNVVPTPPKKPLDKEISQSQAGIVYMLDYNRFESRAAVANDALADILAFGVAMNVDGASVDPDQSAPFLKTWSSNQADYEAIFGAGNFPAVPSERELLRYAVMKDYASVQDANELGAISTEELARRQFAATAVGNRVQLEILNRLEKQNALAAALLSQQMDPLTTGQMRSSLSSISTQRASEQK